MRNSILVKHFKRRRVRRKMDVLENFGMSGRTFKLVYYGNIMLWGLLVTFLVIFIILELVKDSAHSRSVDSQATADYYKLLVPDMREILLWGYQGRGVKVNVTGLFPGHLEEYEDGFMKYNLNKYLSDRISMRRPLPDVRDVECRQVTYDLHDLPKVSVVVVFRNEPRTTLLRMLYSVVDRSPLEIIADIVLVDDGTEIADLQYPRLEHYLSGLKKVRIIRLTKPLGTAKARMHGARNATGAVVIFLQPRCECTEGWMLPLVRAVAADTRAVAVPLVDTIDYRTFQYNPLALSDILVGSFTWALATRKRAPTKPVKNATLNILNPVAADGIFALTRDNLFRLRGLDEGLILEESVNVEFSFRCWLCGSKIVLVPCSHVGYITPRPPVQMAGAFSTVKISDSLRIADSWMGAYRTFVYERMSPPRKDYPPKSIEILTKDAFRCQSFDWFLQKLEPEMSFRDEIHRRGQLVLIGSHNNLLSLEVMGDIVFLQDWKSGPPTFWYHLKSGVLTTENKTCLSFVPRGNTTDQLLKAKSDFLDANNKIVEMPAFILQRPIESQLKEESAEGEQQPKEQLTSKSLQNILFEREHQQNPHPLKSKDSSQQSTYTVSKSSLTDKKLSFTDKQLSLKYDRHNSGNSRKNQPENENMLFEANVKSRSLLNSVQLNSSVSRPLLSSLAAASLYNLFERLEIDGLASQEESEAQLVDTLVIKPCDTKAGGDRWSYTEEQTLQHQTSGLCLEAQRNTSGNYLLVLAKCVDGSQTQRWSFVSSLMSF